MTSSRLEHDLAKNTENSSIGLEAAGWLVRLQEHPTDPPPGDDVDTQSRDEAFFAWLRRSPQHVQTFLETDETDRLIRRFDPTRLVSAEDLLAAARGMVADPALPSGPPPLRASPSNAPRRLTIRIAALARAATVAVALLIGPQPSLPKHYSTKVGERQTIRLPDQSTITLNTSSEIAVRFDARQRWVHLISGEALFEVRHDAQRPFRVITADATLEDLGTEFDVYRDARSARVTVIDGSVRLSCDCGRLSDPGNRSRPSTSYVLSAGEQGQVVNSAQGPHFQSHVLSAQELQSASLWRTGRLNFSGMPLREAVKEVNRYTTRKLVVADPAIADLTLGGTLSTNLDVFLANLKQAFGVQVLPADPSDPDPTVIRLGRPTSAR